jgi:hypothetical protein
MRKQAEFALGFYHQRAVFRAGRNGHRDGGQINQEGEKE